MNGKYVPALFAAALLVMVTVGCTSQKRTQPRETTLQGMIAIYGNEPHSWVGIRTQEGKVYAVNPPEKAAELRDMQGRLLEFTVIIQDAVILGVDGSATVLSWR